MATTTEPDHRYRPLQFFAAAYILTWLPWFIGVWVGSREGMVGYALLLNLVGLLAPPGMALFLTRTSRDAALKYDFKDRLLNLRRIRPLDVFVAVALPFAVVLTSILLSLLIGESIDQFALAGGASLLPLIIIAMILAPIMEETGWHGYGVDSLRAFYGMLKTTLLFGVLWSIWHTPLFFINGTYQSQLVQTGNAMFVINFFVSVIPAAVIANWLYYRNGRSITFAILFHAMLNGAAVLFAASQPAKCIVTVVYATLAIAIIAADRTFREGRRDFLDVASSTQ